MDSPLAVNAELDIDVHVPSGYIGGSDIVRTERSDDSQDSSVTILQFVENLDDSSPLNAPEGSPRDPELGEKYLSLDDIRRMMSENKNTKHNDRKMSMK